MLSLLTCSVSRLDLDDFDSYGSTATAPPQRRVSRKSLSYIIKTASPGTKRRKVPKMEIGSPTGFRHEMHIGKDMAAENMFALWDAARWQQEIEKGSRPSPPSSIAPSTVAPSSIILSSPTKPHASKRNSITPQRRKPVPSLIPDVPAIAPFVTLAPQDIPLPPSPSTPSPEEQQHVECELSKPLVPLLDSPRQGPGLDAEPVEKLYVSVTVKQRWDDAMGEIEQALKEDTNEQLQT